MARARAIKIYHMMVNSRQKLKINLIYKSKNKEEILVLEPKQKPATIIFPHGLGTDAKSRQELVIQNELHTKFPSVKFIFPQAPTRRVNIDAGSTASDFGKGAEMPSWFDIQ